MLVDDDASPLVHFKAAVARQTAVRTHADRQDNHLCAERLPALEPDGDALLVALEGLDEVGQMQLDARDRDLLVQELRHLEVQTGEHLIRALHETDAQAEPAQVARDLEADEAAADHHGALHALRHLTQTVRVRDGPERADPRIVDARDRGPDRRGAGGDHQLVIALLGKLSRVKILHRDALVLPVDGDRLAACAHVNAVLHAHRLGRCDEKGLPRFDHVAHMIGQTAVGVGDVFAPLQQDDLSRLVKAPQSGRAGRAACHPADDYRFAHRFASFPRI